MSLKPAISHCPQTGMRLFSPPPGHEAERAKQQARDAENTALKLLLKQLVDAQPDHVKATLDTSVLGPPAAPATP